MKIEKIVNDGTVVLGMIKRGKTSVPSRPQRCSCSNRLADLGFPSSMRFCSKKRYARGYTILAAPAPLGKHVQRFGWD